MSTSLAFPISKVYQGTLAGTSHRAHITLGCIFAAICSFISAPKAAAPRLRLREVFAS
jgi:hypothetical protein